MGDKSSSKSAFSSRKKLKFAPKIPAPKIAKPAADKREPPDDGNIIIDSRIMKILEPHATSGRKAAKVPAKIAVEPSIASGDVVNSTEGTFSGKSAVGDDRSAHEVGASYEDGSIADPSRSLVIYEATAEGNNQEDGATKQIEEKQEAPWNMNSNYPVSLPWRSQGYPIPELDDKEFEEAPPPITAQDEERINDAKELGLLERTEEGKMLFVQLPPSLPFAKQQGAEADDRKLSASGEGCGLKDLPAGRIGKMMVHKSGAVKMKIGDALFDVTAGTDHTFRQEVAIINTKERHCCVLGTPEKHGAVVTLDVESVLDPKDGSV